MTEATIVIKGRNDLSAAVNSAERSLKGLLKTGDLIGKLFRGGAIAGAFFAFERLAESAEKAAEKVGDQGTARSLRQLNREIDLLKAKGTNVIGKVLGNVYGGLFGDRQAQLAEQIDFLQRMQGRSFVAAGYDDIGTGFFTAAEGAQKLLELEQKLALYQKNQPAGERARAPGSHGGGQSVVLSEVPKAAAAARKADEELWVLTDDTILAMRAWMDLGETSGDAMEQITRDLDVFNEQALESLTGPVIEAQPVWTAFAEQAAANLQSAFAEFLFDPFKEGLDGMLAGFVDVIRQMFAQYVAFQAITGLGSLLSGSSNAFVAGIGSFLKGTRAGGGPVAGGSAYLVGERGPELFVPGANGSIVPNHAMGGAVNVNYHIDARGADAERILAILPPLLERTKRDTVATIMDLNRRGRLA